MYRHKLFSHKGNILKEMSSSFKVFRIELLDVDPLKKSMLLKMFKDPTVSVESYQVMKLCLSCLLLYGVHIKLENDISLNSLNEYWACSCS